jgi:hypothetical protein
MFDVGVVPYHFVSDMTRPDRAAFPLAGLVASILVFAWPQLSTWVRGASPWYPLVTVLFTLIVLVIVVKWPRPAGASEAAPVSLKPSAAIVAGVATALIVVAAYRWTHVLVWQAYQADMLIVIREATRRFLSGRTPYATYRTYDAPWNMAMPYGPGLWGPFLSAQLFRLDFRFLTIAGELFVPLWCGVAASVEWLRGNINRAVWWLLILAALVLTFDVQRFTLIGHTPVYWPLLPLFAAAVGRSKWVHAAFLLAILVLARTTMVALVPVLLLAAWKDDRSGFPRAMTVLFGTIAAGLLPFVVWDYRSIWDNMVLSYPRVMREAVWPVLARSGIETIGLTEWLIERHLEPLVMPAQLVAMTGVYAAAWRAIQRGAQPLVWMALALFAFSMTSLYPVHYLYYDVLLLLISGALVGTLGSAPVRMGARAWLVSVGGVVLLMVGMACVLLSPSPEVESGDDSSVAMMRAGFAMSESDGQRRFSWIVGHEATVVLPRRSAEAAAIVVTAQSPFGASDAPQTVTAILNGNVLGHTTVEAGWHEIPFPAPRSAWWIGFNQLRLVFSSTVSPRAMGAGDDARELALAVSRVSVTSKKE